MSSVLSMQIAQALFPWPRNRDHEESSDSTPKPRRRSYSTSTSDYLASPSTTSPSAPSTPMIQISPAENLEFTPLLQGLKRSRSPVRHRRCVSASASGSTYNTVNSDSARSSLDNSAHARASMDSPAPLPHVGLAMMFSASR